MSEQLDPARFDEAFADADDADFAIDDWALDDDDDGFGGAELSSLRSAWAGRDDRFE